MNGRPYDITTRRALYSAARSIGYGRWQRRPAVGVSHRAEGHLVTVASVHLPYAISRHGLGGIRHALRAV